MAARTKTKKTSQKKSVRLPRIKFETALLRLVGQTPLEHTPLSPSAHFGGNGRPLHEPGRFPAYHIRYRLVEAATYLPTAKRSAVKAGVFVQNPWDEDCRYLPIIYNFHKPYKITNRDEMVRLAGHHPTNVITRNYYKNWSIPIELVFAKSLINQATILDLFKRLSFFIGIGNRHDLGKRRHSNHTHCGQFDIWTEKECGDVNKTTSFIRLLSRRKAMAL